MVIFKATHELQEKKWSVSSNWYMKTVWAPSTAIFLCSRQYNYHKSSVFVDT